MCHVFAENLGLSLSEPFNKFTIFGFSIIYTIVTEFCEKLKVVSSDFSIMKNIVAPFILESFPMKSFCCGSFNLEITYSNFERR